MTTDASRVNRREVASRSQRPSKLLSSKEFEAGALRSLEGDRGLPSTNCVPVGAGEATILQVVAFSFAFLAISVGLFFLVVSAPYIYEVFSRMLGMHR
jgi:hypothetical protein